MPRPLAGPGGLAARALDFLALTTLLGVVGCASKNIPVQPPGKPPTPKSVTVANPGGDAADPELAALQRLAAEPWGRRTDRFNTLNVPQIGRAHV